MRVFGKILNKNFVIVFLLVLFTLGIVSIAISYDQNPFELHLIEPNETINDNADLIVECFSKWGITSVEASFDANETEWNKMTQISGMWLNGKFTYEINTTQYKDGDLTFCIRATDTYGHFQKEHFKSKIDNSPPTIQLLNDDWDLPLVIEATDEEQEVAEVSWKLDDDNWKNAIKHTYGIYHTDLVITELKLKQGTHNLTIKAVDSPGNVKELTIEIPITNKGKADSKEDKCYQEWVQEEEDSLEIQKTDFKFQVRKNTRGVETFSDSDPYVKITHPKEGEILTVNHVNATWYYSNGTVNYFEIFLDEIYQGKTNATWFEISDIGEGNHTLRVEGHFLNDIIVFDEIVFDPVLSSALVVYNPYPSNNSYLDNQPIDLSWTITADDHSHYILYRNGTEIGSGLYTNRVDGRWTPPDSQEAMNVYNITLWVNDTLGNTASNSIFFYIHNYEKYDYDVKVGIGPHSLHNRTYMIEVNNETEGNLVLIVGPWENGGWRKNVDGGSNTLPGSSEYIALFQDYIDAGFEVWVNWHLTLNYPVGQFYNGSEGAKIPQQYQCRIGIKTQNATAGGDIEFDLSGVSTLNVVNATTTGEYWKVYDDTDGEILNYGTGTEQWHYTTASGNVTIHSTTTNHNYSVYYIYNKTYFVSLASDDIVTWACYIVDMFLSNHSYQITTIDWESIGCESDKADFSPFMQDKFISLTGLTPDLKELYNRQWYNHTWQEWYNATSYVYADAIRLIDDVCEAYNVYTTWYDGDANIYLSPEWMAWAGVDGYDDWIGSPLTQTEVRGYANEYQWNAYDEEMFFVLSWYPGGYTEFDVHRAYADHWTDACAGGRYPDHFITWASQVPNDGDADGSPDFGGYQAYPVVMDLMRYWNTLVKAINYAKIDCARYDVVNISIANVLPADVSAISDIAKKLWDVPVAWKYVSLHDINDSQIVPSDVTLIWLRSGDIKSNFETKRGAVTNTTLEAIETFVRSGGAVLVTGIYTTMVCMNGTELDYMMIRDLMGIDFDGGGDRYNTRTVAGNSHWITNASSGLSVNLKWAGVPDDYAHDEYSGLATPLELYTNGAGQTAVFVSTFDSGRMGFLKFIGKNGILDTDENKWDEEDILFTRMCSWLVQNEANYVWLNVTNLPRADANNIYKRLYYNATENKFAIGIFNNDDTSQDVTMTFNSTTLGLTSTEYILFDPIAMSAVGDMAYHTRSGDILTFTTTIESRTLSLVIGKPYGNIIHVWSNRPFVNENWDDIDHVYHLYVENRGLSVVSSPYLPSFITENGLNLVEVDSLSKLETVDSGWYYDVSEALIYIKSLGSHIEVEYKAPAIFLRSPSNNSFVEDNQVIDLEISDLQDDLDTVLYNWNGDSNATLTSNYDLVILPSFNEGVNVLNVYANDTEGYKNYKKFVFIVDNIYPTCALISPLNGTTVSGTIEIHINASGDYLDKVYLIIDSTTVLEVTYHLQNEFIYTLSTSTLSNGYHTFQAEAVDFIGHQNLSSIIELNVLNQIQSDDGDSSGGGGSDEEIKYFRVEIEFSETSVFQGEKVYVRINVTNDANEIITDALVKLELLGETFYCYLEEDGVYTYAIDTLDLIPGIHELKITVKKSGFSSYEETRSINIKDLFVQTYLSDYFLGIRVGLLSIILGCILILIRTKILGIRHRD